MAERSKELIMVGYFLSRFGKNSPPARLNISKWKDTYKVFYDKLSEGRSISQFEHSLKNSRDAFDGYFSDTEREGWKDDDGNPTKLSRFSLEVYDQFEGLSENEVFEKIKSFISPCVEKEDIEFNEPKNNKDINLKEQFADWLHSSDKYWRVYNRDKKILINKLTEYEKAYHNDFGILIFDYPNQSIQNIVDNIILNLNYLSERNGELAAINKKTVGNGSVKAILGQNNYVKFLQEIIIKKSMVINKEKNNSDTLNTIFYGPPGTGKTFHTINEAIKIADPEFYEIHKNDRDQLKARFKLLSLNNDNEFEGQIGFTTFHQSFSYEDFIEGIKPNEPKEGDAFLKYEIQEGVFKKICRLAHDSLNVNALAPKNFVLIVDEINRGNVSSVFGELITLIEKDKRAGADEELSVTLPYSKETFSVPQNVYIIGTMNTADRSIEALDTALRRRFSFREMPPKHNLIGTVGSLKNTNGKLGDIDVVKILETINNRIEKLIDKDHTIGHSYFLNISSKQDLRDTFRDKVIPLLEEYFFGDFGKISLVLGSSFISKESKADVSFATSNDYDTSIANDLLERSVYEITSENNWEFKAIYE